MTSFADPGNYQPQGDLSRDVQVNLEADVTGYTSQISQAQQQTSAFAGQIDQLTNSLGGLGKAAGRQMFRFAAADFAGLGGAVADAASLEHQLGTLRATSVVTGRSMVGMTNQLDAAFSKFPVARSQLIQLANTVANLGVTAPKSIGSAVATFTKLGAATGESPDQLAGGMLQLNRQMGNLDSSSVDKYANALLTVSKSQGVLASGVAEFAQNIAPMARAAGMGEAAVLGISAAFQKAGADGSYAANAFNSLITEITRMKETGDPGLARYAAFTGKSTQEFRAMSGTQTATELFSAISRGGPEASTFMQGLGGPRAVRAFQAVAQAGGLQPSITEARNASTNTENLDQASAEAMSGLVDAGKELGNQFVRMGELIGGPLLTPLTLLTTALTKFLELVNNVMSAFGGLPAKVLSLAGALAIPAGFAVSHLGGIGTLALGRTALGRYSMPRMAAREGRAAGEQVAAGLMTAEEAMQSGLLGRRVASGEANRRTRIPYEWGMRQGMAAPGSFQQKYGMTPTEALRYGGRRTWEGALGAAEWVMESDAALRRDSRMEGPDKSPNQERPKFWERVKGGGSVGGVARATSSMIGETMLAGTAMVDATALAGLRRAGGATLRGAGYTGPLLQGPKAPSGQWIDRDLQGIVQQAAQAPEAPDLGEPLSGLREKINRARRRAQRTQRSAKTIARQAFERARRAGTLQGPELPPDLEEDEEEEGGGLLSTVTDTISGLLGGGGDEEEERRPSTRGRGTRRRGAAGTGGYRRPYSAGIQEFGTGPDVSGRASGGFLTKAVGIGKAALFNPFSAITAMVGGSLFDSIATAKEERDTQRHDVSESLMGVQKFDQALDKTSQNLARFGSSIVDSANRMEKFASTPLKDLTKVTAEDRKAIAKEDYEVTDAAMQTLFDTVQKGGARAATSSGARAGFGSGAEMKSFGESFGELFDFMSSGPGGKRGIYYAPGTGPAGEPEPATGGGSRGKPTGTADEAVAAGITYLISQSQQTGPMKGDDLSLRRENMLASVTKAGFVDPETIVNRIMSGFVEQMGGQASTAPFIQLAQLAQAAERAPGGDLDMYKQLMGEAAAGLQAGTQDKGQYGERVGVAGALGMAAAGTSVADTGQAGRIETQLSYFKEQTGVEMTPEEIQAASERLGLGTTYKTGPGGRLTRDTAAPFGNEADAQRAWVDAFVNKDEGKQWLAENEMTPEQFLTSVQSKGTILPSVLESGAAKTLKTQGALGQYAGASPFFMESGQGRLSGTPSARSRAAMDLVSQGIEGLDGDFSSLSGTLMTLSSSVGGASDSTGALLQEAAEWARQLQNWKMPTLSIEGQASAMGTTLSADILAGNNPLASEDQIKQKTETIGAAQTMQESLRGDYISKMKAANSFVLTQERQNEDSAKQVSRSNRDFAEQQARSAEDYATQRQYSIEDYGTQRVRAEQSYNLQVLRSQRDYETQSLRAQQDYQISVQRQNEDHRISLERAAVASAQSIYDPYTRIQKKATTDAGTLIYNLKEQNADIQRQMRELQQLREQGLSQQAIDTLKLGDVENAQQVTTLAQSLQQNPNMTGQINAQIAQRATGTTELTQSKDWSMQFRQQEEDFAKGMRHASDDFTKTQRQASEDHSKSMSDMSQDFSITSAQAAEDQEKTLGRMAEAFEKTTNRAVYDHQKALNDMAIDLKSVQDRAAADLAISLMQYPGDFATIADQLGTVAAGALRKYAPEAADIINTQIATVHDQSAWLWQDPNTWANMGYTPKPIPKTAPSGQMTEDQIKANLARKYNVNIGQLAYGGITTGIQQAWVSEHGPEAHIPLNSHGENFMSGMITRSLAQAIITAVSGAPSSATSTSNSNVVSFAGADITVQASDPDAMARQLAAKAKLARLASPVRH